MEDYKKKYEDLVKDFECILNLNTVKESGVIFVDDVRHIIPELKESEDEKIRKELIDYCYERINTTYGALPNIETIKRWLAWLEKQGEQTSTDKVESKFKVGDWVVQNGVGIYKIVEVCESWYEVISYNDGIQYSIGFDKENDCRLWTIQDAKDGDVLVTIDDKCCPFIYKGCLDHDYPNFPVAYCGIDTIGNLYTSAGGFNFRWTDKEVQPATKKQRDQLEKAMVNAGYRWNKEELKLEKI